VDTMGAAAWVGKSANTNHAWGEGHCWKPARRIPGKKRKKKKKRLRKVSGGGPGNGEEKNGDARQGPDGNAIGREQLRGGP